MNVNDEELCALFDKEMLTPGCHSLSLRVMQSKAGAQFRERKAVALPAIIRHLESHAGLDKFDLRQAWGLLLYTIQLRIDPDDKSEISPWDTSAWVSWAKARVAS